ncbi:MAG: hypothetical protein ACYTEX_22375 [Planctomycetota bacterium]
MGNIVIQNTTKRAIVLSEMPIPGTDPVQKIPGQALSPGQNDVDDAFWALFRNNPSVKMWVREGYLLEIPNKAEAIPLAHDTTQVDIQSMVKKIYKCTDEATLQEWADNDGRPAITRAVKEQLKELRRNPTPIKFDTKNENLKAAQKEKEREEVKRPRGRPRKDR